MLEYILSLLAQVVENLNIVSGTIVGQITGLGQSVLQSLGSIAGQIGGALRRLAEDIGGTVLRVVNGVVDALGSALKPVLEAVSGIVAQIKAFFSSILNKIQTVVVTLWERVTESVVSAINYIRATAEEVWATIRATAGRMLDTVMGWVSQAANYVRSLVQRALDAVGQVAGYITQQVTQGISHLMSGAAATVQQTSEMINQAWKQLVTGSESIISTIGERLQDVSAGFTEAADQVVEALSKLMPEQVAEMASSVKEVFGRFDKMFSPLQLDALHRITDLVTAPSTLYTPDRQSARKVLDNLIHGNEAVRVVAALVFAVLFCWATFSGLAQANAQRITMEYNAQYPWKKLEPNDAATAWRRGLIDTDTAISWIMMQGYDRANASNILELNQAPVSPFDAVSYWRRGIVTEDKMVEGLRASGLAEEWIDPLIRGTEYIPPVQDLITMAVREVFSPEVAERFGQFQDVPKEAESWAAKVGMSPQWFRNYWGAHWSLPSPQQGFEMLHRGVIDMETLNLLLRAQDVMPFWRDKLTAIAYHPLTRVDVRRMHRLGILTEDQVTRAYLDLGYDDEKARYMTEFTLAYNKPKEPKSADELGALSRSAILSFYGDGLLGRDRALALLKEQGYETEAAALYLESVELAEEQRERRAEAALVVELALAGTLTREQAESRLRESGLTNTEVEKTLATLYRRLEERTKIPTRSEGEQMLKAGVINADEYRKLLEQIGYTPRWVQAFADLVGRKRA